MKDMHRTVRSILNSKLGIWLQLVVTQNLRNGLPVIMHIYAVLTKLWLTCAAMLKSCFRCTLSISRVSDFTGTEAELHEGKVLCQLRNECDDCRVWQTLWACKADQCSLLPRQTSVASYPGRPVVLRHFLAEEALSSYVCCKEISLGTRLGPVLTS